MALAKNLNYINVTEPYPLKDLHFYLKHRHIDRIMVRQIDGCVFDLIQNNLLSNVNYLEVSAVILTSFLKLVKLHKLREKPTRKSG